MKEKTVRITLTEELLGTTPADKNLHETYIASNAPDAKTIEEEIEEFGVDEAVEKSMTIFQKLEDGTPFIYDYQLRGFFKDSIGLLRKVPGMACSKVKAYKKTVDGHIFIAQRKVPIQLSGAMGDCQRPLRASTPMGERVAIAHSETVPAGSTLEFTIVMLIDELEKVVDECLDYGKWHGLGQWRNSGKGRFAWEEIVVSGKKKAAV